MSETAKKMRSDLDGLLTRLSELQGKMKDGPLSQNEGEEFDQKAEEASKIQADLDRIKEADRLRKTPVDPVVPNPKQPEEKDDDDWDGKSRVLQKPAGYLSVGEKFVRSPEFAAYMANGAPKEQGSSTASFKSLYETVGLTREEVKQLPAIGEGVLIPQRDPDVIRVPARLPLTMRSIVNVQTTTATAISYVVYQWQGGADVVPQGEIKPQASGQFGTALAPVRTIAVWVCVTEQMLEDLPALAGIINTELIYDLRFAEEREMLWGDGTGEHFLGLLDPATGVPEIPTPPDDRVPESVIDQILMGITDVRARGGTPTAALIHPYDWEAVQLSKGSGECCLWTVGITNEGELRLWGLTIVPTLSMQDPNDPTDRRLVVGDWVRGATLYDRRQAGINMGWIDDYFIRNLRVIRGEERAAWAVKRPHFFAQAEAMSSSDVT